MAKSKKLTPLMEQYHKIKEENPGSILFFRLGDFYEMFDEDAKIASQELDLTLTSRDRDPNKSADEKVPMCGIPYHASDTYIARLIAKGYKVAICEQVEDPALAKGLVKRDILRVVTPGTVVNAACLDDDAGNYICGVVLDEAFAGAAFCDVSTGEARLVGFEGPDRVEHLINELCRFHPAEALLNAEAMGEEPLVRALREQLHCCTEAGGEERFRLPDAENRILNQFGERAMEGLPTDNPAAARAMGGLLSYLYETQKRDLSHINCLDCYREGRFMELDPAARRNLELTETLRSHERKGSLLWVLDRTKTPMGARHLRGFLDRPLLSATAIRVRNSAVNDMVLDNIRREELIEALSGIGDIERLVGRIVYGTAGGRDLSSLRAAIEHLPAVRQQLSQFTNHHLEELTEQLDPLTDIGEHIADAICDDPPFSVREGGLIRDGYDEEVDRLRRILRDGKGIIAEMEAQEKEKTGIRTLKIGYNKVFGYYIEVSKSFAEQVPETYIRKQTLVNAERYITQELKDLEQEILTASERVTALEYQLFTKLREWITVQAPRIQRSAAAVGETDALASLASVAVRNDYCRPVVDNSGVIEIQEGRHPVVEQMLDDALFVPNDTYIGEKEGRVSIITGPNMAGKSTYMRQVALIVLMAQIGSFVPAKFAHIGVVDRIFTRIGASGDLTAGQSTFMVEMTEVAELLRRATKNSLLILDEIGRGTSTFDGMSIARAVLEYCADWKTLGARTLFATHYHELTELENTLPGAVNYNIAVKTRGEEIIFLRKIVPGGADRSYGIEVARLAGLPEAVLRRARAILEELENAEPNKAVPAAPKEAQETPPTPEEPPAAPRAIRVEEQGVLDAVRHCEPDALTPIEAMSLLYQWKERLTDSTEEKGGSLE